MRRSWRPSIGRVGTVLCLVLILAVFMGVGWAKGGDEQAASRPDLVRIQSMQAFGPLELPPVSFAHDLHTKVLADEGKSCETCHPQVNGQFVFSFQELQAPDKEAAQNLYHGQCVSCHRERKAEGKAAGPVEGECRLCHQEAAPDQTYQAAMQMNPALHAEHIQEEGDTCDSCHHRYDAQSQRLVYSKGEELGCRACHREAKGMDMALSSLKNSPGETIFSPAVSQEFLSSQTPPSLKQAAHLSCLNCHVQARESDAAADEEVQAPLACAKCHGQNLDYPSKPVKDVPRLDRGQPDVALIGVPASDMTREVKKAAGEGNSQLMKPVLFNHQAHEKATESCRTCHHESLLQPCGTCHDLEGKKEGGMVTLSQAMHAEDTAKSCVGCHVKQTRSRLECAGCHAAQSVETVNGEDTCQTCHQPHGPDQVKLLDMPVDKRQALARKMLDSPESQSGPMPLDLPDQVTIDLHSDALGAISLPLEMTPEARKRLAAEIARQREKENDIHIEDIPEEVRIDSLSDQYGPVRFPHAKIVDSLRKDIAGDPLAKAFHANELTLCQGCHHNSQASENPPSCANCHAQPFSKETPGRPGLKAAYHGMCMDCHTEMRITDPANTDCTACHEQKRERVISDLK